MTEELEHRDGEWFGLKAQPRKHGCCRAECPCNCGGHGSIAYGYHYKHCPLYGIELKRKEVS